jgi:hypothetical protein
MHRMSALLWERFAPGRSWIAGRDFLLDHAGIQVGPLSAQTVEGIGKGGAAFWFEGSDIITMLVGADWGHDRLPPHRQRLGVAALPD